MFLHHVIWHMNFFVWLWLWSCGDGCYRICHLMGIHQDQMRTGTNNINNYICILIYAIWDDIEIMVMAGPLGVVPPAAMDPFIDMWLGRLSMTGPFGDVAPAVIIWIREPYGLGYFIRTGWSAWCEFARSRWGVE